MQHTLLSDKKFAYANYISIYYGDKVNIYCGGTAKMKISEAEVLKGWRYSVERLWHIPLTANITKLNTDTLLLNSPDGRQ